MSDPLIFDSHAILTLFQGERGAGNVEKWLRTSSRRGWTKYLCAMNLGEILYATKRRFGDERKIEVLATRGEDALRFDPMKPVGLLDPQTGRRSPCCGPASLRFQVSAMPSACDTAPSSQHLYQRADATPGDDAV